MKSADSISFACTLKGLFLILNEADLRSGTDREFELEFELFELARDEFDPNLRAMSRTEPLRLKRPSSSSSTRGASFALSRAAGAFKTSLKKLSLFAKTFFPVMALLKIYFWVRNGQLTLQQYLRSRFHFCASL